jgi:hypothetical protein
MRLFNSECVYDAENGKWLEKYWVDGKECDAVTYFAIMDQEREIEDKELEEENCECEGMSYGELLDVFTMKILETQGCPGCVREVLEDFSMIFINDEE